MAVGDLSFAFDASKETPDSVAKKRAIAEAIAARQMTGAPRDVGEGLNAIGQALLYRRMMGGADKAESAGRAGASSAMQSIIGALSGGNFPNAPRGGAPMSPMAGGEPMDPASARVAQAHSVAGGDMSPFRDAIASIESDGHGGYAAIGPTHPKLGRALGRYQVMEANIGPWSKSALGREVTPDEFLSNPQIQDAIFDHRFGSYVEKYGNPQDAASAWFTGLPASQGAGRKDVLGTSGSQYVDKFSRALGSVDAAPASTGTPDIRQALVEAMANGGGRPPVQTAQAGMDRLPVMAGGTADAVDPNDGPSMAQLLNAAQDPWLRDTQRSLVNALLNREMQQNDPMRQMEMERAQLELEQLRNPQPKQTDDIREYEFARQQGYQGTFQDFMTDMKRAGATNVTTNVGQGSSEYNKALDKKFAEQYITMQDGAQSARNKIATLQGLGSALDQTGYTGMGAESILAMKQAGRMLGLDIGDNLGPEETARALGNQLALQMRSPSGGAGMPGAMSDKDREFLVASVPGLSKTPEGNRRLIDYMMRIEERNIQVAQLAQAYADENGQIDNGFYKQLSEWSAANPMFPEQGGNTPKVYSIPEGIDPSDWEFMTPEEKALFQ